MSRLHYLYEQQGTGKERFIYYCSSCSCVLGVKRDLGAKNETAASFKGYCLGCGRPLESNMECKLAPVPDEWSDIYLKAQTVERELPVFRQASSFPHFSLGFPQLDSLLRPFSQRFTTVIRGAEASVAAELAAFRAQLPLEVGGLDSAVVFIDGGNRSDPYTFSSFARQYGYKPNITMRRIATCRVFTMYQLADLISEHLAAAATEYAARFVVISDLLGTFNEPELDEREAQRLLSSVEQAIKLVKKNALVLITLVSPSKYDETVLSWADTAVSLTSNGGRVSALLLKHPSKAQAASSFKQDRLLKITRAIH